MNCQKKEGLWIDTKRDARAKQARGLDAWSSSRSLQANDWGLKRMTTSEVGADQTRLFTLEDVGGSLVGQLLAFSFPFGCRSTSPNCTDLTYTSGSLPSPSTRIVSTTTISYSTRSSHI